MFGAAACGNFARAAGLAFAVAAAAAGDAENGWFCDVKAASRVNLDPAGW